ncbi:unnamed protein product, partial [Ectocarpus sp. 8 AP-2014]
WNSWAIQDTGTNSYIACSACSPPYTIGEKCQTSSVRLEIAYCCNMSCNVFYSVQKNCATPTMHRLRQRRPSHLKLMQLRRPHHGASSRGALSNNLAPNASCSAPQTPRSAPPMPGK